MKQFSAREYFAKLKIGDILFKNLINAVRAGENTVMQNITVESMVSSSKWIAEIENLLFSVEQIVKDPKKSIIDESMVVQIEKAKRVSSQSIRHLSSHSNYVRAVDDDGTVHPLKIMTTIMDEDLLIYENRFVYTLIQRLLSFIEQKIAYLAEFSEKTETVRMNFKSDFSYQGMIVEYDLSMKVKKPVKGETIQDIHTIIEKLDKIKRRVRILTGSEFYKNLSKTTPLTPPIAKTNIIKMNVDYSNAYKLWLFISSFVNTGYSVKVSDVKLPIEYDYYDDLVYLVVVSIKTMAENGILKDLSPDEYEDQNERDFYIEQDIKFIPDYNGFNNKENNDIDYLNDFYYHKIKEILKAEEEKQGFEVNKEVFYSFSGFYKQLAKINNTLFEELLYYDYDNDYFKKLDEETRRIEELKYHKEVYKRHHILTKLKKIDLNLTMRKDAYLLAKIKKLEQKSKDFKGKKLVKSVIKGGKSRKQIIEEIDTNDKKLKNVLLNEISGKKEDKSDKKDSNTE